MEALRRNVAELTERDDFNKAQGREIPRTLELFEAVLEGERHRRTHGR